MASAWSRPGTTSRGGGGLAWRRGFGIDLGSHCVDVGLMWGRSGADLGRSSVDVGGEGEVQLGTAQAGTGLTWRRSGINPGSIWGRLGLIRGRLWVDSRSIGPIKGGSGVDQQTCTGDSRAHVGGARKLSDRSGRPCWYMCTRTAQRFSTTRSDYVHPFGSAECSRAHHAGKKRSTFEASSHHRRHLACACACARSAHHLQ